MGSNHMAGKDIPEWTRSLPCGSRRRGVASFLTVWTTIVRDDGNGMGIFAVIMAVAVGWFAASFRPAGMARTMLGVAIMRTVVGILIATAPVTANVPGESFKALAFSGLFAMLWLVSGAFLRAAAKGER